MRFVKILVVLLILVVGFFVTRLFLLGQKSHKMAPTGLGVQDGKLAPCPNKPNCVSSQASPTDAMHYAPPIQVNESKETVLKKIADHFAQDSGCKIIERKSDYIRVECTTVIFRFTDDIEIYMPEKENGLVHFRSASRVGYSDLGANRKRVESLRALLKKP